MVAALRHAIFTPSPSGTGPQVKHMLDWRCARGKRRKYSSKKRIVCQEEKRLSVKMNKKELVCQMEKSLYMKRNYEESVCQEEKSFFQEEE